MNKQNINSKKGFTIIEVVLVLAIAGLIFLMVFIAYPALRRSQSDTQRREDMSKALSQLTSYIANNRKPPMTADAYGTWELKNGEAEIADSGFFYEYLTNTAEGFRDPDDNPYVPLYMGKCKADDVGGSCWKKSEAHSDLDKPTNFSDSQYQVYYFYHAKCDEGSDDVVKANGDKEVAIAYKLEGGGMYCGSNSN